MADLRELDPRSPEYAVVARFVAAVAARTGRPTRWNGRILVDENPEPHEVGLAHADGTMTLSEPKVLEPLRRTTSGQALTDEDLADIRDAAATAAHEGAHLVDRDGDPVPDPVADPSAVALNEGLVEIWTHDNLDDVIHDAGLDRDVPRLVGRTTVSAYPAYTAATTSLLEGLEPLTGKTPDELARRLMATDPSQRWNLIADLAIDHELAGLPAADRDGTRTALASSLRTHFDEAQGIQQNTLLKPDQKRQQGLHVGIRAANLLGLELDRVRNLIDRDRREHLLTAPPATWAQPATAARPRSPAPPGFATSTADPAMTDRVPDPAARTMGEGRPDGLAGAGNRVMGDAEIEHLNGILTGQESAAKAPGFNRSGSAGPETGSSDGARPDGTRSPSRPGHTGPRDGRT